MLHLSVPSCISNLAVIVTVIPISATSRIQTIRNNLCFGSLSTWKFDVGGSTQEARLSCQASLRVCLLGTPISFAKPKKSSRDEILTSSEATIPSKQLPAYGGTVPGSLCWFRNRRLFRIYPYTMVI